MCNLCSSDQEVRDAARLEELGIARRLREIATLYEDFAYGEKPHGDRASNMKPTIQHVIRKLVEDWV